MFSRLDGRNTSIWVGGNGANGDILLFDNSANEPDVAYATIHLNGLSGDIILQQADCAEEFDITDIPEAGTTMIIGEDTRLRPSHEAVLSHNSANVAQVIDFRFVL
jgi:hypothetical protein